MLKQLAIPVIVVALLAADYFYFKPLRDREDAAAVSESFLRKGSLGKTLRAGGYLQPSADSELATQHGNCASNEELDGFDYHNTFRLRLKIHSNTAETVHIKIELPEQKRYRRKESAFIVYPGKHYYNVNFTAKKDKALQITITTTPAKPIIISDMIIDGRYGRKQALLIDGELLQGEFNLPVTLATVKNVREFTGVKFVSDSPKLLLDVATGIDHKLYTGLFPGKKNQGHCRFVARTPARLPEQKMASLPSVDLQVDNEKLRGPDGIVANKEGKGSAWEIPAGLAVNSGQGAINQAVGLRFHGGTPGRKKDIESFRVYSRKRYGGTDLDPEVLFGNNDSIGVKTIVFKYTYQVFFDVVQEFNPFIHALALDVANAVGAIVPRHGLVDFNINGENQGLFLAMEHPSTRTIKHWLGHDDFETYVYKKGNLKDIQKRFFLLIGRVLSKTGDEALSELGTYYDINNVINSTILSAYIADDDYCQGVEILTDMKHVDTTRITSVNWDLDHAFIEFKDKQFNVRTDRLGFSLLKPGKTACPRQWGYSWAYQQSPEFRRLVRQRFEQLINGELSVESMSKRLDYYREINQAYYNGKHQQAIDDLQRFINERPAYLLAKLNELEKQVEDGAFKQ